MQNGLALKIVFIVVLFRAFRLSHNWKTYEFSSESVAKMDCCAADILLKYFIEVLTVCLLNHLDILRLMTAMTEFTTDVLSDVSNTYESEQGAE